MAYVEYDSNNSGGKWWLNDDDWKALERAGWVVAWNRLKNVYTPEGDYKRDGRGLPAMTPVEEGERVPFVRKTDDGEYRQLGALAGKAYKPDCDDLKAAARDWERITGKSCMDAGCPCCGQPHTFTLYDDKGQYVESGPSTNYTASWD